jgi:hypothetical protein
MTAGSPVAYKYVSISLPLESPLSLRSPPFHRHYVVAQSFAAH